VKLGIVSDSHGNRRLLHEAVDQLTGVLGAGRLLHLGDYYDDAEELRHAGYTVDAVPGLQCAAYRQPQVPNTLVLDFDGLRISATHADTDLGPKAWAAQVVMHGHTHHAIIDPRDGQFRLNPGHLKAARDRGDAPSFALLETTPDTVTATIYELDGRGRP